MTTEAAPLLDTDLLVDRDRAHVWHPYASTVDPLPVLPVVAARGTRLVLADGRQLVDGMSSWWAAVHGYAHPVLDAALHAQVDRLGHVMFGGLTHAPAVELAELLVSLTPAPLTRVFFADSGSVAVEVALKMALQHWQGLGRASRTRILTVRGGYHGDTAGAMSVCDPVTGMHGLFSSYVAQQLFAPPPRPGYAQQVREDDLAGVADLLERHPDEVAAVIVEPVVQGAGGMRFYAPEYLRRLRALCDEHDVLLVLDEIATGFGRTGELFGADHAGVVADIVCVGKALTGGYLSMAATLCTDAVADAVSACGALMHGPTFMANPLACAMGLASTRLLLSRDWRGEVASIGTGLRDGLAPAADLPQVRDVRVLGAIGVVELHDPVDMRVVQPALVARGAWVRPFGRLVYTMPPFVSTPDDVAVVSAAIVGAVREAA